MPTLKRGSGVLQRRKKGMLLRREEHTLQRVLCFLGEPVTNGLAEVCFRRIPAQHNAVTDPHQQRGETHDGLQRGVDIHLCVDRFGHLEQGGGHPGFFLLCGVELSAFDGKCGLVGDATHHLQLAIGKWFAGILLADQHRPGDFAFGEERQHHAAFDLGSVCSFHFSGRR